MRLPGPLRWVSLASSVAMATAPAAMAVYSAVDGEPFAALIYLIAAGLMFAIPELLIRRLPGPAEILRAALDRLLDALIPWRSRSTADAEE